MKNILFTSASLAALTTGLAQAQQSIALDELVISVGEVPIEEERTGATVDVLSAEDIAKSPDARAVNTIDRVPGVTVASNGGVGSQASVFLRGLPARYVGFRLNGIDITDPSNPQVQADPGGLTSAGLGRIEVLKGAQSAIYGSEAIGGVIDIRSDRLSEDGQEIRFGAEYGSFDTRRADVTFLQKSGDFDISLSLSRFQTDGFSAADENDGNTEADGFDGITGLLSLSYGFAPGWTASLDALYQNDAFDIDGFAFNAATGTFGLGDLDQPNTSDRRGARAYVIYEGAASRHELSFSYYDIDRRDPLGFNPIFLADRSEIKYDGQLDVGTTTFVFGADYTKERAELSNGAFETSTRSAFGEIQYAANADLDLSAALRFDDHDRFGFATTGRLAMAWRPTDALVLKAALGNGFRAPSIYELFGPSVANPDLDPEESRSLDLSAAYTFASGARIEAVAFYNEIDNLIEYVVTDPVTFAGGYAQTEGVTKTRGLELSGSVPLSDTFSLFGNYTFTDAEDASGTQIRRVPRHDIVLGLDAEFGAGWSGQLVVNHVAGRIDPAPMPDYTVANLQISYDVAPNLEVYARIENLFDEEYQRVNGYGTSDRALYVGFRATY